MSQTYEQHRTMLALRDALLAVLREAMKERNVRSNIVNTAGGAQCEWVLFERQAMTSWVNHWRDQQGLPPVDIAEVAQVERRAADHIDYAEKYALYCAELAMRED